MTQILGWIANMFFVYGVWIIGNKNVKGFYLNALGNLFYAWQAPYTNNHPLFWLSILLILINLKGIYQWQFKNKKKLNKIFKDRYQCPICKRNKFDRDRQPHNCKGGFRKKLPLFKKVMQDAEQKYNSELNKIFEITGNKYDKERN